MNSFIHKTGYSGPLGAASVHLIRFSQLTGLSVSHFVTQSASLSVRFSVRFQSVSRLDTFSVRRPLVRKTVGQSTVVQSRTTSYSFLPPARQCAIPLVSQTFCQSVSHSVGQSVSQSVILSVFVRSFVFLFVRLISQSIYQ